jgi:hypothetical protein
VNHGMLLSFSFEPDLSHTSILYTILFYATRLYESWMQVDSKN